MKVVVLLFLATIVYATAQNIDAVVDFANKNWDCADPQCSSTVPQGSWQDNYECAEFVARSLAAGGYIPNLGPLDSQSAYGSYRYNGHIYNLLWVSSKGGNRGLEDFLIAAGWGITSSTNIQAGYVVIVVGSDGPFSHVGIGVGNGIIDAHNAAEYQVSGIGSVNAIYSPPGSGSGHSSGSSSGSGSGPASGHSGSSQSGSGHTGGTHAYGPHSTNGSPSSSTNSPSSSSSSGSTYVLYFDNRPKKSNSKPKINTRSLQNTNNQGFQNPYNNRKGKPVFGRDKPQFSEKKANTRRKGKDDPLNKFAF